MMILVAAFMLGMGMLVWLAEDGTLEDGAERAWINYLADQSRKTDAVRSYTRRAHVQRPAYKYAAVYKVVRK